MTEEPELQSKPVTYDIEDLVALSNLVPRSPVQIFRLAAGAIVILLFVVIVAEAWALTGFIDWPAIIFMLVVAVAILLLSNRRVRARLWLRIARRSPLHAPTSYAVGPGAFRVSSSKAHAEIPWTTFRDVKVKDGRLFVFMTQRLAYIVPRRAFDTDAEFEAFSTAAVERWEQRHRL
jgi:hypothetical protein